MATQLAERTIDDFEAWTCVCGKEIPRGISLCPKCGRPSPYGDWIQIPSTPRRVRAVRLAFGVIGLNIVIQIVFAVMVLAGRMESSQAITFSVWGGMAFYAVVLAMIAGPLLALRPDWLRGNRQTAPLLGIEVGLAAAAALITVLWVGTGEPVLDPSAYALVSEGSPVLILLAFLVIAVAAPLVEELLFRGVVAQALGRNGATVAIAVSSFLFALAHLRSLAYYTACGVILGVLYWRRGLWASIAAHATFNGALIVLALVVSLGPSRLIGENSVTVRAPAGWQQASAQASALGAALAVQGPGGSTLVVRSEQAPAGGFPNLEQLADLINDGAMPLPGNVRVTGSARVLTYRAGEAIQIPVEVDGHDGVVALIPKGTTIWTVEVATGGSPRAEREYGDILESLSLPGGEG